MRKIDRLLLILTVAGSLGCGLAIAVCEDCRADARYYHVGFRVALPLGLQ